jgi:hypothetical protein
MSFHEHEARSLGAQTSDYDLHWKDAFGVPQGPQSRSDRGQLKRANGDTTGNTPSSAARIHLELMFQKGGHHVANQ